MPDLKTEMSKVLNEWENHEQSIRTPKKMANGRVVFTVTNNVSRETFNYVKASPNSTSAQVCAVLEKRGFKESSVGSLLAQFVKQGMMSRDESGRYKTLVPEYTPLKSNKATKSLKAVQPLKRKVGRPKGQSLGIAALKPEAGGKATGVISSQWDAETVINNIGLKQARALYDELKKIFGG